MIIHVTTLVFYINEIRLYFGNIISSTDGMPEEERPPWRKLLWVKQPYPDNYVDSTFLSQLKHNSHVQPYTFIALCNDSLGLVTHLCLVCIFGLSFYGVYVLHWNELWFLSLSWISGSASLKSWLLIVFTLLALSPVLKSLTQSTSSDSIWALAFWLCVANVCVNDYSASSPARSALATNSALSAAIVLASRLPTTMKVFCFLLFSLQLFGVFPNLIRQVKDSDGYYVVVAALVVGSAGGLGSVFGWLVVALWITILATIVLGLPGILLALQKYKNEIQGPWDPARPIINE